MSDLIERKAVLDLINNNWYGSNKFYIQCIEAMHPAYPKKGHWVKKFEVTEMEKGTEYSPKWYCSECDTEYTPYTAEKINFCSTCGADMRESE